MHYQSGQTVYIEKDRCATLRGVNRVAVVVQDGFIGRDGREWYVFERPSKNKEDCAYDVAPYAAFYDSETAESNFHKLMREPAYAKQFLQRTGIIDKNGELAEIYRT